MTTIGAPLSIPFTFGPNLLVELQDLVNKYIDGQKLDLANFKPKKIKKERTPEQIEKTRL